MANTIQIKRGAGAPGPGVLLDGELGFDRTNKQLYIGNGTEPISLIPKSAAEVGAVAEPVYTNHFFEQKGWYKIGTMSIDSSARLTLTIGGSYYHNPSRVAVIEILGDYDTARCQTIVPTPNADQITKIGVVTISRTQSEIYAYYNGDFSNTVYFYIHASMGNFTPCTPSLESISESSMMDIVDTSKIVLAPLETKCYGSTLPAAGTPGRIFFKKVSS